MTSLTLTETKDAYGTTIKVVTRTPELLTSPQAAKSLGISTVRFSTTVRKAKIDCLIVAGTEKNHYPVCVYTPEQVARVAEILNPS